MIEDHVESPGQEELYRIACCRARLGEDDAALEELRRAIEINPGFREWAETEEAFAALREHESRPL